MCQTRVVVSLFLATCIEILAFWLMIKRIGVSDHGSISDVLWIKSRKKYWIFKTMTYCMIKHNNFSYCSNSNGGLNLGLVVVTYKKVYA
jgi:hypothetical protein